MNENEAMPQGAISGLTGEGHRRVRAGSWAHACFAAVLGLAVACVSQGAEANHKFRSSQAVKRLTALRACPSRLLGSAPGTSGDPTDAETSALRVSVVDENAVAVRSAQVSLTGPHSHFLRETDAAGRLDFSGLEAGLYQLRVEKEGFYTVVRNDVRVGEVESVEITLNHVREYKESVNVVYSPPAIDPQKTSDSRSLTNQEIINVPYPVSRDIRYALPMLPRVLQDPAGQLHIDGSSTRMILDLIDGYDVTDPATGLFNMRVSVDALQSVEVQSSRVPAEYGKGSGGAVNLKTAMGDNRLRFSATDMIPSLIHRRGFHVSSWTPRATVSGPLWQNRAWFLEAADGEYDQEIFKDLPLGADRASAWRFSNLAKTQVNLLPGNILNVSLLVNNYDAEHLGLGPFTPLETTVSQTETAYLFTVRDQWFFPSGLVLEAGTGLSNFRGGFHPLGGQPYIITPDRTRGNFFETTDGSSSRVQGTANAFMPRVHWGGSHEFKVGLDLDSIGDHQSFLRRRILILREDSTLSRRIAFSGGPSFVESNFEASVYGLDRWSPSDRWLIEPGVRVDWDELVHSWVASPRVALTYVPSRNGTTKLVGGVGIYHDATNLDLLTRSLTGHRTDLFYDRAGQTLARPPLETSFLVNPGELGLPRFLNWSGGVERMMPHAVYLRVQFIQKRGSGIWTFINQGGASLATISGRYELKGARQDHFDALEVSARRAFKSNHMVFASYTRSSARSNAFLNFSIDNPLFSPQAGGPLPWDTPNRFISWGWLPFLRGFNFAYWLDWRDGFPFFLVNQNQQVVAPPGAGRFPTYFSLNLSVERRFKLLGMQWAMRGGFDDVTNRSNPTFVNNNVDSPAFHIFGGVSGRTLVGRLRLLGRK
jgi:carboxypeptidase family protein/TonB-dependent receptor-like protein